MTPAVLVTNDDGVAAPGLAHLVRAVVQEGYAPAVAAPITDRSGAGAGLHANPDQDLFLREVEIAGLPDIRATGVDGPPSLAVLLAMLGRFGARPRVVAAGINAGLNTGRAILHSGTVGAALSAATMGSSGMAVSIEGEHPEHWETASRVARAALGWLATRPRRTVLNVNVPDLAWSSLNGVRWGRLAAFGKTRLTLRTTGDRLRFEVVNGALPLDPDTDVGLVAAGYAVVTPLTGISAAADDGCAAAVEAALDR